MPPPIDDDEPDEKPRRRRPVDDDEPDEKPRRRRPVDDDEEEDDRPPKHRGEAKKSEMGKVLLVVGLVLFLLCGGAVAGTIWAVKRFNDKAIDTLANVSPDDTFPADKATEKAPPQGDKPAEQKADNGLDVRFIASDFFAGAVLNGPKALRSPVVANALPKELLDEMASESGIDAHKVERLVVLADPTPYGEDPLGLGFLFYFREPVDGAAILAKTLDKPAQASFDGKSYLKGKSAKKDEPAGAGYIADERTILIAQEPMLKKMLSAKGDGPLAKELKRLDLKADAAAAFVMEPVRDKAGELLGQGKDNLGPDFADLGTLHERLKTARLTLRLDGDTLLTLVLEADNEASAEVLEKLLVSGRKLLKEQYPGLRKNAAASLPPQSKDALLRVADQLPDSFIFAKRGKQVTATLAMPAGINSLGPALGPLFIKKQSTTSRPAGDWKTFTSREQGFSATFPGEPKKTVQKAPDGDLVTFAWDDGPTSSYTIMVKESSNDLSAASKIMFDSIAAKFGKAVKSRREITLKDHPGMELVLEPEEGGQPLVITNRIYLVKKRMYQVMVGGLRSKQDPERSKKFLDSFALLEDAPVPPPPPPPPPTTEPIAGLPPKPLPKPTTPGDSLKGDARAVMDVLVTTVKLPVKTMPRCLTWADEKGSAFYTLDEIGELRRLSFPDLKEEWKLDVETRCSWLALSAEGLLLTLANGKEVWLIDPAKGKMKGRFAVPGVKRAAATPGSSLGIAATGRELYVLDLKKMTAAKFSGPGPKNPGYDDPVLTPDGKYLITGASGQIHRYALADGQLRYEESSAGVTSGRMDSGVTVSPDSKRVCYPSYVGGGTGKIYTLAVFKIGELDSVELVLDPGGTAVAFDPPTSSIYTNDLRLYDNRGRFVKEYDLGGGLVTRQILPHPQGGTLLVLTGDALTVVNLPKK
jgi:hypothetical protein